MPRCRPFKLVDAMILVAVAALALAEIRPGWNQFRTFWAGLERAPSWQAYLGMVRTSSTIALLNLVAAYIWIRLVPPRLKWADRMRQPGMLALLLLIGLLLVALAVSLVVPAVPGANLIFALVLGLSWGGACLRYRARAEPGWIEHLGRAFGVGLILAIAAIDP